MRHSPLASWLRQARTPRANAQADDAPEASMAFRLTPAQVLCPAWPRLEAAKAIVARYANSPKGMLRTWEACAGEGLIPTSWVNDSRRIFCIQRGLRIHTEYPHPSTARAVIAIAADPTAVLQAEQFLDLHETAMAAWFQSDFVRSGTAWWVGAEPGPYAWQSFPRGEPAMAAFRALEREIPGVNLSIVAEVAAFTEKVRGGVLTDAHLANLRGRLSLDLRGALAWRMATDLKLVVLRESKPSFAGIPFASLADPYAPLEALWSTGFSVGSGYLPRPKQPLMAPTWRLPAAE